MRAFERWQYLSRAPRIVWDLAVRNRYRFHFDHGEVSDLIRSPAGFHLIRVLERKGGEPRPFAEVQFRIREELSQAEAEKKFQEWVKDLRAKAYVEIRL